MLERWEKRTTVPLIVSVLLFLIAYATPIIWPGIALPIRWLDTAIVIATWVWFGIDYLMRLRFSPDRWAFIRHNLVDLAALVLPIWPQLRFLRLIALLSILNRVGSKTLRGKVLGYAIGGTAVLVLVAALGVTEAEQSAPGATITSFPVGLWWAFVTLFTVGYGDVAPVTATGRIVAVTLMIGGMALLGTITATLSSWLVERVSDRNAAQHAATHAEVEQLRQIAETTRAQNEQLLAAVSSLQGERPRGSPETLTADSS